MSCGNYNYFVGKSMNQRVNTYPTQTAKVLLDVTLEKTHSSAAVLSCKDWSAEEVLFPTCNWK